MFFNNIYKNIEFLAIASFVVIFPVFKNIYLSGAISLLLYLFLTFIFQKPYKKKREKKGVTKIFIENIDKNDPLLNYHKKQFIFLIDKLKIYQYLPAEKKMFKFYEKNIDKLISHNTSLFNFLNYPEPIPIDKDIKKIIHSIWNDLGKKKG